MCSHMVALFEKFKNLSRIFLSHIYPKIKRKIMRIQEEMCSILIKLTQSKQTCFIFFMQIWFHTTSLLVLECIMTQTWDFLPIFKKTEELNQCLWFIREYCSQGQNNFRALINVQNCHLSLKTKVSHLCSRMLNLRGAMVQNYSR